MAGSEHFVGSAHLTPKWTLEETGESEQPSWRRDGNGDGDGDANHRGSGGGQQGNPSLSELKLLTHSILSQPGHRAEMAHRGSPSLSDARSALTDVETLSQRTRSEHGDPQGDKEGGAEACERDGAGSGGSSPGGGDSGGDNGGRGGGDTGAQGPSSSRQLCRQGSAADRPASDASTRGARTPRLPTAAAGSAAAGRMREQRGFR